MRALSAFVVSSLLLTSSAFAADVAGALASGKPAGVRQAQVENSTPWLLVGIGAVALIAVLAATGGDKDGVTTPVTTGTAG